MLFQYLRPQVHTFTCLPARQRLRLKRCLARIGVILTKFSVAQAAESDKSFSILQPGSSVATALSEGEAKKKHVVILEILGEQWRTFKFPLRTVRPFTFDQVCPCLHLPHHHAMHRLFAFEGRRLLKAKRIPCKSK